MRRPTEVSSEPAFGPPTGSHQTSRKSAQRGDHLPLKLWNYSQSLLQSFIIVRPPPSKSNHPLNLQVQLVPPNIKPPNGVVSQSSTSMQSNQTESDHVLARTSSGRSVSSYSNYGSSTSSFSSVASSSASTRRTIVPLYNLQAHNVMTNVIVDAGTDAKIAKFQRRGIVLIDLASLEPVEVWGDSPSSAGRHSINLNVDETQVGGARNSALSSRSITTSSRAHTPEHHLTAASSIISLNSARQSQTQHQNALHPQSRQQLPPMLDDPSPGPISDAGTTSAQSASDLQPTTPVKRNIFGKLFQNKKQSGFFNNSPTSPSFAISPPPLQEFSPVTPKPPSQTPQTANVTPTTNTNQGTGKSHMRNLSLTNFTSPLKTPFRNSKNKLPTGAAVSSSSSSLGLNAPSGRQVTGPGATPTGQYIPSPNMSASSLAATSESMESGSAAHSGSGHAHNPVFQTTTSHLHPPSHTPQPSTGSATSTTAAAAAPPQTQLQQLQSRPPVLGIQPTYVSSLGGNLSGPGDVKKKLRALMYVWLVRRWFKRSLYQEQNEVSFTSVATGGGGGGGFLGLGSKNKDKDQNGNPAEPGAGVEVRVEWKRGKARVSRRGRSGRGKSETDSLRRRSIGTMTGEGGRGRIDEEGRRMEREKSRDSRKVPEDKRLSKTSMKSLPSVGSGNRDTDSEEGADGSRRRRSLKRPMSSLVGSDGEESDPEDSETAWVCTLKVRRTTPASHSKLSGRPNTAGEKEVLKLKVGTLSPTPHHPKVVAMLKVPFPLPDVEVERLSLRRRLLEPVPEQGGTNEFGEVGQLTPHPRDFALEESRQDGEYRGLLLTAEEIKDIVCSTALWLIVREGTGGVGRISRKGDGWKLRS